MTRRVHMQDKFDLPLLQAIGDWRRRRGAVNQNIRRGQVLKG
jgi:hypothetical protein